MFAVYNCEADLLILKAKFIANWLMEKSRCTPCIISNICKLFLNDLNHLNPVEIYHFFTNSLCLTSIKFALLQPYFFAEIMIGGGSCVPQMRKFWGYNKLTFQYKAEVLLYRWDCHAVCYFRPKTWEFCYITHFCCF